MVSAATESGAPYLARFEADDTSARAISPSGYPVVATAHLEMNRVVAMHLARNLLAGRTLKQVGMQREGRLRQRLGKWDQFEDVIVCGILRSDRLESL